jgi:putative membrane protein
MGSAYLYVKAFHILFVASWFAGLFYLPRIYVNMAQETNPQVLERLLGMSFRLYRFMTILMVPAVVLGLILWLYYGVGKGPGSGWMHAKLFLVFILLGITTLVVLSIKNSKPALTNVLTFGTVGSMKYQS